MSPVSSVRDYRKGTGQVIVPDWRDHFGELAAGKTGEKIKRDDVDLIDTVSLLGQQRTPSIQIDNPQP